MSFCSFALTGCKDGGEPDPNPIVQEKKITKIAVTTRPRLKYIVGERFDKTGMVVTATYDDGTTEEVTDYTIDKTEPLTVKDNSVTVMYKGKLAYIPIVVGIELYEQLTIPNADNNVYTVEAEALDYSNCDNSNVAGTPPSVEAAKDASGGFSMGALAVPGNMFGFKVTCEEEVDIDFVIRASAVSDDIVCDDALTLYVNDVGRRSEHIFTWGGDGAWWDWEHAYYHGIKLNKGVNEIYLKMNTQRVPNFDCFYIVTSPTGEEVLGPGNITIPPAPEYDNVLDIDSAERAEYLIEAEDLDYSRCQSSNHPGELPNYEIPDPARETSGDKCMSSLGVAGNRFGFAVTSTVQADMALVLRVSSGGRDDQVLDEILQVKWNDTVLETNTTLIFEEVWHDWKDVKVYGLKLEEGKNVFDFFVKAGSAPNVDCFKILVDPEPVAPEEPVDPAPEYGKKLDISSTENAEYTVEAETLSLSKCTHSSGSGRPNQEAPATETSGGLCVSSLGYRGNKLGFTVASTVEGVANLTLRVSAGAPADQALDELLKLTWNKEEYVTGYVAPNPLTEGVGWHNWGSATMYNLPLTVGNNVFELEVVGDGCPNLDCFILEVSPDNTGVDIPVKLEYAKKLDVTTADNAQYKIEGESLALDKCAEGARYEGVGEAASGGLILSSWGVNGNKVGFTVTSTVACKINISMHCAAGGNGVQTLDDIIKICWNKTEYKTGAVCPDPQIVGWHQFQDAVIEGVDLVVGNNVFEIEVVGDAAPNIDYFVIEVSPVDPAPEVHECAHVCATCNKCTDETCADPVCEAKCDCTAVDENNNEDITV